MSIATADAFMAIFGMKRVVQPKRKESKIAPKICKCCGNGYTPARPMQKACSLACAQSLGKEKTVADKAKSDRKALREGREAIKTARDYLKPAQDAFNAFIRERDKDLPCICCGKFPDSTDWKPGGTWDAGHFLSRGAYPELRFEETNCHKQLKTCNGGSNKYAKKGRTVSQGYKEGIVARIGQAAVDWLEGPHPAKNYSIDDLKAIKALYVAKLKELKNGR